MHRKLQNETFSYGLVFYLYIFRFILYNMRALKTNTRLVESGLDRDGLDKYL
jgi:hypothetical protein